MASIKAKLFIGSSGDELERAQALATLLENVLFPIVWADSSATFMAGSSTLESLLAKTQDVDFAAFLLAPDDKVIKEGKESVRARDNVIFELGLFMGVLGRERTLIVVNKDVTYPSDLLGITHFPYEPNDEDLHASMTSTAAKIRQHIKKVQNKPVSGFGSEAVHKLGFGISQHTHTEGAIGSRRSNSGGWSCSLAIRTPRSGR